MLSVGCCISSIKRHARILVITTIGFVSVIGLRSVLVLYSVPLALLSVLMGRRSIALIAVFVVMYAVVDVVVTVVMLVWRVHDAHIVCCSHVHGWCAHIRNNHHGCVYFMSLPVSRAPPCRLVGVCVIRSPVFSYRLINTISLHIDIESIASLHTSSMHTARCRARSSTPIVTPVFHCACLRHCD